MTDIFLSFSNFLFDFLWSDSMSDIRLFCLAETDLYTVQYYSTYCTFVICIYMF